MPHQNAPFTPEGRRRLIERIIEDGRPISHVADEAGISRQRLTVWLRRYEMFGDAGLEDRSSRPARSPNQTSEELEDRIEQMRRTTKHGPDRIRAYTSEEDRRNHLVPFLNDYNHDRPHSAIGNRPPISRAPVPGSRLTHVVIELPPDHPGQLSLDLDP